MNKDEPRVVSSPAMDIARDIDRCRRNARYGENPPLDSIFSVNNTKDGHITVIDSMPKGTRVTLEPGGLGLMITPEEPRKQFFGRLSLMISLEEPRKQFFEHDLVAISGGKRLENVDVDRFSDHWAEKVRDQRAITAAQPFKSKRDKTEKLKAQTRQNQAAKKDLISRNPFMKKS